MFYAFFKCVIKNWEFKHSPVNARTLTRCRLSSIKRNPNEGTRTATTAMPGILSRLPPFYDIGDEILLIRSVRASVFAGALRLAENELNRLVAKMALRLRTSLPTWNFCNIAPLTCSLAHSPTPFLGPLTSSFARSAFHGANSATLSTLSRNRTLV